MQYNLCYWLPSSWSIFLLKGKFTIHLIVYIVIQRIIVPNFPISLDKKGKKNTKIISIFTSFCVFFILFSPSFFGWKRECNEDDWLLSAKGKQHININRSFTTMKKCLCVFVRLCLTGPDHIFKELNWLRVCKWNSKLISFKFSCFPFCLNCGGLFRTISYRWLSVVVISHILVHKYNEYKMRESFWINLFEYKMSIRRRSRRRKRRRGNSFKSVHYTNNWA